MEVQNSASLKEGETLSDSVKNLLLNVTTEGLTEDNLMKFIAYAEIMEIQLPTQLSLASGEVIDTDEIKLKMSNMSEEDLSKLISEGYVN